MKTLTIKYKHKDFFGTRIYTEDTKRNFTKADLTKAFLFFSKNWDSAVQIDDMCIYWDGLSALEKKEVSVRIFNEHGYTEGRMSFEKLKKNFYAKFKKTEQAA